MILVYPYIYMYVCFSIYLFIYIVSLDIIHYRDDRQTAWRTKDAYINRMIEETAPAKSWKTTVGLGRENTLGCNAVPVSTPKFLVISCITCNHLPTFMNLHQNAQRGFHLCMLSDSINVNVHYPKALWPSGKYPSIIYKLVSDLAWYIEQQSHFWAPIFFSTSMFFTSESRCSTLG